MPNIRPSADVRNHYPELSRICKETKEPIYITVNGHGDTALIDINALEALYARLEMVQVLTKRQNEINQGNFLTEEEFFEKLKKLEL